MKSISMNTRSPDARLAKVAQAEFKQSVKQALEVGPNDTRQAKIESSTLLDKIKLSQKFYQSQAKLTAEVKKALKESKPPSKSLPKLANYQHARTRSKGTAPSISAESFHGDKVAVSLQDLIKSYQLSARKPPDQQLIQFGGHNEAQDKSL